MKFYQFIRPSYQPSYRAIGEYMGREGAQGQETRPVG